MGCAFLAVAEGLVIGESQHRLTDGTTVFPAEVRTINKAITDAQKRGLREIDVYSDSRSALKALNSLVPRHRVVAQIKTLVQHSGVKVIAHWIKAHVGHPANERVDVLAKAASGRHTVDVVVNSTC